MPGFFIILAGNSARDFEYKKKAVAQIVAAYGQSLKSVEAPELEGILLCQCIRTNGSIRETFRDGNAFISIPIMVRRDLNIKWVVGAGEAKKPLIKEGFIVDDGGGFFGWGVEQGHLGKTEIFCRYHPTIAKAKAAVEKWQKDQNNRAYQERYFANLMSGVTDEMGRNVSNYNIWWDELRKALDPKNVTPESGSLV